MQRDVTAPQTAFFILYRQFILDHIKSRVRAVKQPKMIPRTYTAQAGRAMNRKEKRGAYTAPFVLSENTDF